MRIKKLLVRALEDADVVRVREIIEDASNQAGLEEEGMELVTLVCGYLTLETQEALPHVASCCQDTLATLAIVGNPKELLMAQMEQLDTFQHPGQVVRLLPSVSTVLTRVKKANMSVSWGWALSTVSCHLKTVSTPINMGLEGAERITLEQTREARECLELCEACVQMVRPLVDIIEEHASDEEEGDNKHRRTVMINFLLSVLPSLSTLPQHPQTDNRGSSIHTASANLCDSLIILISRVTRDIWTNILLFPESCERKLLCESEPVDSSSVPMFLYLLLVEKMCHHQIPSVFTHLHLLRTTSQHIITLLKSNNHERVYKGLLLLDTLLTRISPGSLSVDSVEDPALVVLLSPLVSVTVYHDVAEGRKLGFSCYTKYVGIWNLRAKSCVYHHLLNTVNHSGLLGWTVTSLKDSVLKSLTNSDTLNCYSGQEFRKLVEPLLKLKHGPETDLLEISDELLSSIGFVRVLLGFDKNNKTGIIDLKDTISSWVEDLTKGLQLSVAHYEQKMVEPLDTGEAGGPEFGVSVGGRELPVMEGRQMREVITSALNTFSIIQFNLGILKDLL